ncbi:MAG: drug/metabolite transporter (DMT)-like permease [Parasphingorhabdus sp.]|jgi:drug/metabolite transporter (DMT)-like permease
MVLAMVFLAGMDVCAKYLSTDYHVVQVLWVRYIGHFALIAILLFPTYKLSLFRSNWISLQLARSLLMALGSLLNFMALRYLQLDQTAAIAFTSPFWVLMLSGPLLGEKVGRAQIVAIMVGFIGVLIITRPGFGDVHWAVYLSLSVALVLALFQITTRKLAGVDGHATTQFYTTFVGVIVVTPIIPWYWQEPSLWGWVAMILIGVFGLVGHYLLIIAHRLAPASALAPFVYTQIVWMVIFGFLIFADVPDSWTIIGGAIVVASGLFLWYRDRQILKSTL